MVEDVINSLGNIKLTLEEEEDITISDEGRKEEIESCTQSLIGKFLTCKSFNKRVAHNMLRKAWGVDKGMQIVEVGLNLFQFKFKIEFDLERVLRGGPWSFDNQVLMVRRWQAGCEVQCGGSMGANFFLGGGGALLLYGLPLSGKRSRQ